MTDAKYKRQECLTPQARRRESHGYQRLDHIDLEPLGIDPADVHVTVTDGGLVIKGEKKAEKEEKGKDWHRVEQSYGSFQRTVDLPLAIAEDKVQAEFSKGVLKVTLPKAPSAQAATKKIAIKTTN